jgi:hypothetical protein
MLNLANLTVVGFGIAVTVVTFCERRVQSSNREQLPPASGHCRCTLE